MRYAPPASTAFPVLRISQEGISAEGSFAETQASYLRPDPRLVKKLDSLLSEKKIGIVAHFYMDPELQGVLASCKHPHVFVSDSLLMADRAVEMAREGARSIIVLGVDFMSENVRAMLDAAGFEDVPVYRAAEEEIGCSLAESAETEAYRAYLEEAARNAPALHVVYINTSLQTKAEAQTIVPTITCTSSNVVRTVLTAAAELPELNIFFGPDTYMGENLESLFRSLSQLDDAAIKTVHPAHDRESIARLLERFHYFREGSCVVHHLFGDDVVRRVRAEHADAYITAHLEVPGGMFALALEAETRGRGIVGSTSNILRFILEKVDEAIAEGRSEKLEFILGTEAGMITPIVRGVEERLAKVEGEAPTVEIVFPVASGAIAPTGDLSLPVVPGVAAGDGCSVSGGCVTCPHMKMNNLHSLLTIAERIDQESDEAMSGLHPESYTGLIAGVRIAELGARPILHMRDFQRSGALSEGLHAEILGKSSLVQAG